MTALYAGLVCWLVTTVLVDGAIFDDLRRRVRLWGRRHRYGVAGPIGQAVVALRDAVLGYQRPLGWRSRVAYLVDCHLCAGVWVGLALGAAVPGPLDVAAVGWVLNGLLYKAIAHLLLEVVSAVRRYPAVPEPTPLISMGEISSPGLLEVDDVESLLGA